MDIFYLGVEPFLQWSMIGVVTVPLLMILLRRQYTRRWAITALVFFSLTWLILFADLGDRIVWFMD